MTLEQIRSTVKNFILSAFLQGADPSELTLATPLLSGGILDSLAMIRLVVFLEKTYAIEIKSYEITAANFENIALISEFVLSHKSG